MKSLLFSISLALCMWACVIFCWIPITITVLQSLIAKHIQSEVAFIGIAISLFIAVELGLRTGAWVWALIGRYILHLEQTALENVVQQGSYNRPFNFTPTILRIIQRVYKI